jgi:DNA ligase-associated metallophosphoesterase
VDLQAGGERLRLLPQRAAFLPEHQALLVADAHVGKAVSFRRLGVPVPRGTTSETLASLDAALAATGARQLVFLGDFLHSARSHAAGTQAAVADWRARHAALHITLVRGNHDDRAGDPPAALGIRVVDEPLALGGLRLAHHPDEAYAQDGGYVIAGHLHPCVTLGGRAKDSLRLPCFHFGPRVGVLPAFGAFTGMHAIRRAEGDRVFAVAEDRVLAV